jgi:hypothetical protein
MYRVILFTSILCFAVYEALGQTEIDKTWKWIIPTKTTKLQIEKKLGGSVTKDKNALFQSYQTETEKISIIYSKEKTFNKLCRCYIKAESVISFIVSPACQILLSDFKIDLLAYEKDDTYSPREIWYTNESEGILVVTAIAEIEGGKRKVERITSWHYSPKLDKPKKNKKK